MIRFVVQVPVPLSGLSPVELATLLLYSSSTHTGWDGPVGQACRVPGELESWHTTDGPDLMQALSAGGSVRVERRQAQGSWNGGDRQKGDLILHWDTCPASEARFRKLSAVPTWLVNRPVNRQVVSRVAHEVVGVKRERLELVDQVGFRDTLVTQIASAIWRELEQQTPAGQVYVQTAAQLLTLHLLRQYICSRINLGTALPSSTKLTGGQLKQVLEFIRTHLSEQLSLDTMAQHIGLSRSHFARAFRQAIGASPHQFVLRQRIERAQQLLAETNLSLAQVAEACGFAHQSHMTQIFTQQLGRTPLAFRRGGASGANS